MSAYKRIILKLSGETLAPTDKGSCYSADRVQQTAKAIAKLSASGVQLGVIMGGGNIWRGRFTKEMNPVNADQMGMLATLINALCLADALKQEGCKVKVFTAQQMDRFSNLYKADDVDVSMNDGEVALLAGGTGNPFFTTDTAAVLRAAELKADAVFKGTNVAGVFDKDPNKHKDAKLISRISYKDVVAKGLRVMDMTAFQMCIDAEIPVVRVFQMDDLSNIQKVAEGDDMGTTLFK